MKARGNQVLQHVILPCDDIPRQYVSHTLLPEIGEQMLVKGTPLGCKGAFPYALAQILEIQLGELFKAYIEAAVKLPISA